MIGDVTGVLALALFLPRGILSVLDSVKLRRIELKFGNYGLNFTSGFVKQEKLLGLNILDYSILPWLW